MESNNRFLVDTHIFIWWMEGNKKLSRSLLPLLQDSNNQLFLSVVSIWEMILKQSKKKLVIPHNFEKGIEASGFILLPIEARHVLGIRALPSHHQDPFDRLLIAQAKTENLVFITDDAKIKKYNIKIA